MSRLDVSLALAAVLVTTGCFSNHTMDGDAGGGRDTGVFGPRDDAGEVRPVDGGDPPRGDAASAPFRDAGVRPLGDAGPPGDRAGEVWTGYIESWSLPSGSDRVRIVFDSAPATGPRTGIVVFGEAAGPPPATDPNVGYPVGARLDFGTPIVEGFEYHFDDGIVEPSRIRLAAHLGELYSTWCALQYPVPYDETGESFGCLPNSATISGDMCAYQPFGMGDFIAIDCGRLALCQYGAACACTASECVAAGGGLVPFDFHVTGDEATGTVDVGGLRNVYLTR
jgi:hypothetical protein